MTTTTSFKGVTNIGQPLETDQLEANLASFFQWGALGIGAFTNVTIPTTGAFGGNKHRLRLSSDPAITSGRQWEGFRKDWVWESNVEYAHQPIAMSGVNVNGTFYPSATTGTYAHHIDYPNGAIVFDNPIPVSSVVTAEYSYRNVQVGTKDAKWFQLLQQNSFRIDNPQFLQSGSGDWAVPPQLRMQLPALVVDVTTDFSMRGKQIGDSSAINSQVVWFHILADNSPDMTKWVDILRNQWQHRISMYDRGAVAAANAYPILANGSLASGAKMYPDLVKTSGFGGYFWRQLWFKDVRGATPFLSSPPLWYTTVKATVEFDT